MQAISISRTSYCLITVLMHFVVSVHFFVVLICTTFCNAPFTIFISQIHILLFVYPDISLQKSPSESLSLCRDFRSSTSWHLVALGI